MMYSFSDNDYADSPRNVIALSTTAGTGLNAIWKQKEGKWYIGEAGNERNLNNVVDILTPRQFQDAIENGKYFFKW
jgi:hypothetical protein